MVTELWHAVRDLVEGGGPFVLWIFACGALLWTLLLERGIYFAAVAPREVRSTLERWKAREDHVSWCALQIRRAMLSRVDASLTEHLMLIRALVPLAPLLGLIGTVSGMLEVFDSMSLRGSVDARTMASGVSHAMICTMAGLAVSLTGLYPLHYFQSRARRTTEVLARDLAY